MDLQTLKDVFTNKFIIFTFIILLLPLLFFNKIDVTKIIDLKVVKNNTISVGEGEPCRGFNIELKCSEGLECVLTSTSPTENGVCLKEGTVLEDDPILRDILIRGDDKDVIKKDDIYNLNINRSNNTNPDKSIIYTNSNNDTNNDGNNTNLNN